MVTSDVLVARTLLARRRCDNVRAKMKTHLFCLLILTAGVVSGCEDNANQGCRSDAECRSGRQCVNGVCEDPIWGGEDTGPSDSGTDLGKADAGGDTTEPDATEPDLGPMPDADTPDTPGPISICQAAEAHIEMCGFAPVDLRTPYDWSRCNDFDDCAAGCALELTCADLACDLDPDVDCARAPFSECIANTCTPGPTCEAPSECVAGDTCCGDWVCLPPGSRVPPNPCDCDYVGEHPGCECADGDCLVLREPESLCEEALRHFEGFCGRDIDDFIDSRPEAYAPLDRMRRGECNEDLACFGACLTRRRDGDTCSDCYFDDLLCQFDGFTECLQECGDEPDPNVCELTGGVWGDSDCENCCGPADCGGDPRQQRDCAAECCGPPQCYCPGGVPFYNPVRGCVSEAACQ